MVDKRGWHKSWREGNGQRIHDSGLVLEYRQGHLQRLCREAEMWVNREH